MDTKERYPDEDERTPLIRGAPSIETHGRDRLLAAALWSCVLLPVGLLLFLIIGYTADHINIQVPRPTSIAIIGIITAQ
jgi:hypothetical protein